MTALIVTVADVISWKPCGWDKEDNGVNYTPRRVRELAGDKTEWTALELLDLPIPAIDRLWLVLRPELIDEKTLHRLARKFALAVLYIYEEKYPGDKRPRNAVETKLRWINGDATDEELDAARDAALAARAAGAAGAAQVEMVRAELEGAE